MPDKVLKVLPRYLLSFVRYRESTGGGGVIFTPQTLCGLRAPSELHEGEHPLGCPTLNCPIWGQDSTCPIYLDSSSAMLLVLNYSLFEDYDYDYYERLWHYFFFFVNFGFLCFDITQTQQHIKCEVYKLMDFRKCTNKKVRYQEMMSIQCFHWNVVHWNLLLAPYFWCNWAQDSNKSYRLDHPLFIHDFFMVTAFSVV